MNKLNELMLRKARTLWIAGILLGCCLSPIALAQGDDADIAATATTESEEIDEIVVLGAHSLTLLRQEVIVAEDKFFDLYNELNDDDRFDIICENRRPIGTRIQVRECKARFVRDAEVEATQNALVMDNSPANVAAQPIRASKEDYETLDKKLKTFAVENPELQKALMEYDNLSKKYSAEREKKFD